MARNNGFTPTEKRIMDLLSDWKPHTVAEIKAVVDELVDEKTIPNHITNIRVKLGPRAMNIMCAYGSGQYQLVSTTPPDYEE